MGKTSTQEAVGEGMPTLTSRGGVGVVSTSTSWGWVGKTSTQEAVGDGTPTLTSRGGVGKETGAVVGAGSG